MPFSFEALDVYHRAIDFAVAMLKRVRDLPEDYPVLLEDLVRATTGIGLKIAVASGTWNKSEKKQLFLEGRSSCYKCVVVVEIAKNLGLIEESERDKLNEELEIFIKILSKLAQPTDKGKAA